MSNPQQGRRRGSGAGLAAAGLALGAAALLLLCPLPRDWEGGWRGQSFDLGHVPLFAALTAALWRGRGGAWYVPVLPALALAALPEVVQPYFGRSGSLADFLRGGAG